MPAGSRDPRGLPRGLLLHRRRGLGPDRTARVWSTPSERATTWARSRVDGGPGRPRPRPRRPAAVSLSTGCSTSCSTPRHRSGPPSSRRSASVCASWTTWGRSDGEIPGPGRGPAQVSKSSRGPLTFSANPQKSPRTSRTNRPIRVHRRRPATPPETDMTDSTPDPAARRPPRPARPGRPARDRRGDHVRDPAGHRRSGRDARAGPRRPPGGRPPPPRGRPGPGQDADHQDPRRGPRRLVQAHPVHART